MRHLSEATSQLERDLLAKMSEISETVGRFKPGASWQQIAGIAFVTLTAAFAILAYASDRFDGGISAYGTFDATFAAQKEIDEAQNARLDRIIEALEVGRGQPKNSPQEGQN
jgi:hypothetical protein